MGILFFLLSISIGCLNDALSKFLIEKFSMPIFQIIFFRYFFSIIFFLPKIFRKREIIFFEKNICVPPILRGAILTLAICLWSKGVSESKLAAASVVSFTGPIFVLALSPFFFNEKVTITKYFFALVGFFASVVAVDGFSISLSHSLIFLVLATVLFSLLDIMYKKSSNVENFTVETLITSTVPTVVLLPATYIYPLPADYKLYILFAILGVGNNLLIKFMLKAYSSIEITKLVPYRYTELLFSSAMGYIFFSEIPSLNVFAGAITILLVIIFMSTIKKNNDT